MANYINRPVYGYATYGVEYSVNGIYYKGNPSNGIIGLESKTGSQNPDWEVDIAKKLDATTAYSRKYFTVHDPGYFDITAKKLGSRDWSRVWGYWASLGPYATVPWAVYDDTVTRDIAVTKIKRKIASDKEDYAVLTNLVQDVYEFRRTIHGTMDSILSLLRNVSRLVSRPGRVIRSGMLLEDIANLYLAWTFGINPTIEDAKALGTSIDAYIKRTDHTKRFQGSHYHDGNDSRSSTFVPTFGITLKSHERVARRYSCKYISGHRLQLLTGNNYGLADHFHLAPTDFIPMAWELLPWSWLWDYVFNIGPFLEDVFQSTVDTSYYNVECINERRVYLSDFEVLPGAGWVITNKKVDPRIITCGTFTRNKLNHLPGRILRLRTQYEIEKNLTNKIANIAAVLVTRQSRLGRRLGRSG